MASSETDICNLALAHLGDAPILSLDDDSAAGRACRLHYAQTRDEVLRSHRWNFATKRATLSQLADAPEFQWSYQYELPADCLRVVEFNETAEGDWISTPFVIEGRQLLTNEDTARIIYIRRLTDIAQYDSLAVKLFALGLAIALTESIRGTSDKTAELTSAYQNIVGPLARRTDANEGTRRKGILSLNSLALRARGGVGGFGGSSAPSSASSASTLTGAQIIALINAQLGSSTWQAGGGSGSSSLTSPNAHVWVPTIANDGAITWTETIP